MEFCKSDKIFLTCIAIVLCLLIAAVPFFIIHVVETDIARNSMHTTAKVTATGEKGIQLMYTGSYGEQKTAEVRTDGAYAVGNTIPISVYRGHIDLLET